jgi:hypothetical protein
MTYIEVVNEIEGLVREAGAKSFWTGAKTGANINYNVPFPAAEFFSTQPRSFLPSVVRYSIGMGLYGKDLNENGGEQTLQIQSDMDQLAQRFEVLLRESESFELQERAGGAVLGVPTIRNGSKSGTGLFIDFTIDVPRVC